MFSIFKMDSDNGFKGPPQLFFASDGASHTD